MISETDVDDAFATSFESPDALLEMLAVLEDVEGKDGKEISKRHNGQDLGKIFLNLALELCANKPNAALFRRNKEGSDALRAAWFGEFLGKAKIGLLSKSLPKFQGLSGDDIRDIAKLSNDESSPKWLPDFIAEKYGIVLIYHRSYPSMKMDGLVVRLGGAVPVVGLSLRYPRYNNFWFTLVHELSHISLHYDQLDQAIFDNLDENHVTDIEVEANRFAADAIIPRGLFNRSSALRSNDISHILSLARQAEVHPALVAGALQHYKKDYRLYSSLVNSLNVRKLLGLDDA